MDFILGPFSSGFNMAASKITEKYGKIMIESGGASDSIFTRDQKFTFATQTSASWWFKDFFDMISQMNPPPRTYALITPDKLFTRSVAKGVQIWAATKKIEEVYYQVVDEETDNFLPYLLEMIPRQPDIIILTSHYQDAQSSATGVIYQLALEKCNSLNAKEVLKNIRELDVETFYGKVKYDSRGMNIGHKMALIQVQQGEIFHITPCQKTT